MLFEAGESFRKMAKRFHRTEGAVIDKLKSHFEESDAAALRMLSSMCCYIKYPSLMFKRCIQIHEELAMEVQIEEQDRTIAKLSQEIREMKKQIALINGKIIPPATSC